MHINQRLGIELSSLAVFAIFLITIHPINSAESWSSSSLRHPSHFISKRFLRDVYDQHKLSSNSINYLNSKVDFEKSTISRNRRNVISSKKKGEKHSTEANTHFSESKINDRAQNVSKTLFSDSTVSPSTLSIKRIKNEDDGAKLINHEHEKGKIRISKREKNSKEEISAKNKKNRSKKSREKNQENTEKEFSDEYDEDDDEYDYSKSESASDKPRRNGGESDKDGSYGDTDFDDDDGSSYNSDEKDDDEETEKYDPSLRSMQKHDYDDDDPNLSLRGIDKTENGSKKEKKGAEDGEENAKLNYDAGKQEDDNQDRSNKKLEKYMASHPGRPSGAWINNADYPDENWRLPGVASPGKGQKWGENEAPPDGNWRWGGVARPGPGWKMDAGEVGRPGGGWRWGGTGRPGGDWRWGGAGRPGGDWRWGGTGRPGGDWKLNLGGTGRPGGGWRWNPGGAGRPGGDWRCCKDAAGYPGGDWRWSPGGSGRPGGDWGWAAGGTGRPGGGWRWGGTGRPGGDWKWNLGGTGRPGGGWKWNLGGTGRPGGGWRWPESDDEGELFNLGGGHKEDWLHPFPDYPNNIWNSRNIFRPGPKWRQQEGAWKGIPGSRPTSHFPGSNFPDIGVPGPDWKKDGFNRPDPGWLGDEDYQQRQADLSVAEWKDDQDYYEDGPRETRTENSASRSSDIKGELDEETEPIGLRSYQTNFDKHSMKPPRAIRRGFGGPNYIRGYKNSRFTHPGPFSYKNKLADPRVYRPIRRYKRQVSDKFQDGQVDSITANRVSYQKRSFKDYHRLRRSIGKKKFVSRKSKLNTDDDYVDDDDDDDDGDYDDEKGNGSYDISDNDEKEKIKLHGEKSLRKSQPKYGEEAVSESDGDELSGESLIDENDKNPDLHIYKTMRTNDPVMNRIALTAVLTYNNKVARYPFVAALSQVQWAKQKLLSYGREYKLKLRLGFRICDQYPCKTGGSTDLNIKRICIFTLQELIDSFKPIKVVATSCSRFSYMTPEENKINKQPDARNMEEASFEGAEVLISDAKNVPEHESLESFSPENLSQRSKLNFKSKVSGSAKEKGKKKKKKDKPISEMSDGNSVQKVVKQNHSLSKNDD